MREKFEPLTEEKKSLIKQFQRLSLGPAKQFAITSAGHIHKFKYMREGFREGARLYIIDHAGTSIISTIYPKEGVLADRKVGKGEKSSPFEYDYYHAVTFNAKTVAVPIDPKYIVESAWLDYYGNYECYSPPPNRPAGVYTITFYHINFKGDC